MIVETMSYDEIRQVVIKELPEMNLRMKALCAAPLRQFQQSGLERSIVALEAQSAKKNHWYLFMEMHRHTRKEADVTLLLHVHFNDGFRTIAPIIVDGVFVMCIYTAHFYRRYNERRQLGLIKPVQIVKAFHKQQPATECVTDGDALPDGSYKLILNLKGGLGLGVYYPEAHVQVIKTFVNDNQLFKEQRNLKQNYWTAEIEEEVKYYDLLETKMLVKKSL